MQRPFGGNPPNTIRTTVVLSVASGRDIYRRRCEHPETVARQPRAGYAATARRVPFRAAPCPDPLGPPRRFLDFYQRWEGEFRPLLILECQLVARLLQATP